MQSDQNAPPPLPSDQLPPPRPPRRKRDPIGEAVEASAAVIEWLLSLSAETLLRVAVVGGLFICAMTAFQPRGLKVLVSYAALGMAAGSLASLYILRSPRFGATGKRMIVLAAVAAAWYLYARVDRYDVYVETRGGDKTTTYSRGGTPLERRVHLKAASAENDAYATGPLSPSGKRHGRWHIWTSGAQRDGQHWYWYDEEVSEGRWHELARD